MKSRRFRKLSIQKFIMLITLGCTIFAMVLITVIFHVTSIQQIRQDSISSNMEFLERLENELNSQINRLTMKIHDIGDGSMIDISLSIIEPSLFLFVLVFSMQTQDVFSGISHPQKNHADSCVGMIPCFGPMCFQTSMKPHIVWSVRFICAWGGCFLTALAPNRT